MYFVLLVKLYKSMIRGEKTSLGKMAVVVVNKSEVSTHCLLQDVGPSFREI